MKRADEEYCKAQFDAFLRKSFVSPKVTWEDVETQDEPPEYYLRLGDLLFAVEVTTLVEKVLVGTRDPLPHAEISKILQDFVDEVGATAKAGGYLHGDYLVSFSTPIDNFKAVRDEVQEGLLDYIQDTGGLERVPLKIVFERILPLQRPYQCGIQKVGNELDRIRSGTPFWMKWEGDARVDLCSLLDKSLNAKVYKLRKIAVPKILLLLDEYIFADPEMYEKCIPLISSLSFFHTVFVAQGNKRGFVLYSQHSDWSKQKFIMNTAVA
jgi:hypothetical protein